MPEYIDSYYLVNSRESKVVYNFFAKYSFVKKKLADDYPIPQYSDSPERIFYSDADLLLYLENNFDCEYLIYWENIEENSEIRFFILQYTNDGKMILGVSIVGKKLDSKESVQLFIDIKNYLNSQKACITIEEPPPTNSIEFIDFCNVRYIPNNSASMQCG